MKDSYKYSDGERWTYKRDWFNPRVSKAPSKCWKDQRKSRHQYKNTPHFDLYEPFERDECGIVMTDEQIDELCYLFSTYDYRIFA